MFDFRYDEHLFTHSPSRLVGEQMFVEFEFNEFEFNEFEFKIVSSTLNRLVLIKSEKGC